MNSCPLRGNCSCNTYMYTSVLSVWWTLKWLEFMMVARIRYQESCDGGKDPVPRVLWWWQGSGTKGPVMVARIQYQGSCDGGKDPVLRVLWWWKGSGTKGPVMVERIRYQGSCDGGKDPGPVMAARVQYLWWWQAHGTYDGVNVSAVWQTYIQQER